MNADQLHSLVDIEVGDIDLKDAPDFANAYIYAAWIETSLSSMPSAVFSKRTGKWYRPLSEGELNYINAHHSDFVYEQVIKKVY